VTALSPAADDKPSAAYRWYALILLTAIGSVHFVDRSVISVVIEPIKKEFAVSDSAMGALSGVAHSAALSICVLPMGWLADRVNRVRLLSAIVAIWSAATALGALATGYLFLLFARIAVGATEAGGVPVSVSLIADLFPPRGRSTAMGVYYISAALGTGLIFLFGGAIAQHYGWRTLFLVAGLPGLVLAVVTFLTLTEPRAKQRPGSQANYKIASAALLRSPPLGFAILAGIFATVVQTSTWAWMASFLIRSHHLSLGQAGVAVALSAGVGKAIGAGLSGPLGEWASQGRERKLWRVPSTALLLSIPVGWAMVTVPGADAAIALSILLGIVLGAWAGPCAAIVVAVSPAPARGTAIGAYQLFTNLIGASAGPFLTGALSDRIGGSGGLATAIGVTLLVNIPAALAFFAACRVRSESGESEEP
jgi:MFS family permease